MVTRIDRYVIHKVMEKRAEKGMTQDDLAYELDVPRSFIAMIESGKYGKKYNVAHLNILARLLECSPQEFLPKEAFEP